LNAVAPTLLPIRGKQRTLVFGLIALLISEIMLSKVKSRMVKFWGEVARC